MGKVDIIKKGEKYGYVSLTGLSEIRSRTRYVEAKCVCGSVKFYCFSNLKEGVAKSCGCKTQILRIKSRNTHGMAAGKNKKAHPIYLAFHNMHKRCNAKKGRDYRNYGKKGIVVCPEWHNINKFIAWALQNGWEPGLTLERKNGNKNYSPKNCIWATYLVQGRNTSKNVYIAAFGENKCIAEWCTDERCLVGEMSIVARIKKGWTAEEAISIPPANLNNLKKVV